MNPLLSPEIFDQEQQDRALLNDAQRGLVKKIIRQSSREDLTDAQVRIYSAAIANFQKIALARDRIDLGRRRIDANYNITRAKCDTQLEIAQIRAEAATSRRPDHPQVDDDDPLAPWGRKKDGTPYTHEEFKQSLNEAIRDIWGLKPINPNSYMPWEMKRASDGTLIPPDDPDTAPSKIDPAPDRPENPLDSACRLADHSSPDAPIPRAFSSSRDPFDIRNPSIPSPYEGEGKGGVNPATSSSPTETAPARYPSEDG